MNSDSTGPSSSNWESREKLHNYKFVKKPLSFETAYSSEDSRTMLEDFEEGYGLSHPSKLKNSSFIPDYSFSSNANLLNVTEATEMLEHAPQTFKNL
ncbi:unnamed protein product [Rhizopus stolonifer]